MNIRQYFINKLRQKQSPLSITASAEDIGYIHEYLAPMKDSLGEDFDTLCHAVFTLFKNQISVFTNDQTACQNSFTEALAALQKKHPVLMNMEELSAGTSPEAIAAAQEMQETPAITNYLKVMMLQQILVRYPERAQAITQDKKTPLELSKWLTNIVAIKATQGHEALAETCSTLSFKTFRSSFQIHSELPALDELLSMDLQKDFDEISATLPMTPKTTLEEFKSDIVRVYREFEQQHAVFSTPLIQEAYEAYQEVVATLTKHLSKGPRPQSLLSSEHAFAHLPQDKEDVTSLADFQKSVIEASMEKPVLVDFWAAWCGPCNTLSPIIDDIAKTHQSFLSVVKIDVDKAGDIVSSQRVRSMPTLTLFFKEKEIGRMSGLKPKDEILSFVQEHLSKEAAPK
ncbi:thioredoxin family protein [Candidatus Synchoanobacter obligatus]|uniref:Thioredoxin domain-containing protein n=1 Tax=Candidatus Synchoanobacter obligatus TaxID=2919597 RepID=A0ABT1L3J6_9GAMM|nr:thioredoxin domain-containing protein [Candidatus Synchoanobacter obligatus]MCP8351790.1 thioredoxin domain-containing protein [Candidatus Synchoanobacter obligatus]